MAHKPTARDYSLLGRDAELAVAEGLAAAEWYRTEIPRSVMKDLMKRQDGPAIRDTIIWLGLLALAGGLGALAWGTWWAVPLFACYGILYGTAAEARWHECSHGTAFKTRWMNDAIYQLACFMLIREPTVWRWSHTRHHTDTIIVGRDPEIAVTRPPNLVALIGNLVGLKTVLLVIPKLLRHAGGRLTAEEATFVPESEWGKVFWTARIWLAIHGAILALSLGLGSWLPAMLVGVLPYMYGSWLARLLGATQHAGLAEDVLDHRLNSRTILLGPVLRFLYWNMNYHVEHHMFPMVPYFRLPELHAIMRDDCPRPYRSLAEAYREMIPALLRQRSDPTYFVRRELPEGARPYRPDLHGALYVDGSKIAAA